MERQLRAGGGIMTLEEPRQGYFLGKIVKKAKRAVKKVVKSPIGKAAIIAGLGAYAGGLGPFAAGGRFASIPGAGFGSSFLGGLKTGFMNPLMQGPMSTRSGGLGRFIGSFIKQNPGKSALLGLGAAGVLAPFLMGGDEEEEEPDIPFTQTPDSISNIVAQARNQDPSLRFLPKPRFVDNFYAADGGRAGYDNGGGVMMASNMENDRTLENLFQKYLDMGMSEIEAEKAARDEFERMSEGIKTLNKKRATAAEGGLMDLGGFEKDYREGGFVPLGAEERADDVPARLSKNEFVFTADAVRNAGGGDIDKGAEVMQNMMDNLEAGGSISEESQGMENPAQEMFDQAQMLESRIA
jgi:hypothetical protein